MPAEWRPRIVSFGSGGVRIIGNLGVLAGLLEAGVLTGVQQWWGCSGGAICAVLGALGVSAAWIRDCVRVFEAAVIGHISEDLIADYVAHWGVNSGDDLVDMMGRFMDTWEAGASQWTFGDLARERPTTRLHITALNVSRHRYEVLNVETAAGVKITEAIRASSAIPLFFMPWRGPDGSLYCDGAVIENFPWRLLSPADRDDTLVIVCTDRVIRRGGTGESGEPIGSLTEYLRNIFYAMRAGPGTGQPRHWIAVNNRDVAMMDFGIDVERRLRLMAEGEAAAAGWVAFMRKSSAGRRVSHLPTAAHHSSDSADPAAPERTSDSPAHCAPPPGPCSPPRPHTSARPRDRRWSL